MKQKEKIASAVSTLLQACLKKMHTIYKEEEITDFYIHFPSASKALRIVDDNDTLLASVTLPDDLVSNEDGETQADIRTQIRTALQEELARLSQTKAFDDVNVFHPFSFVLEDDGMMEDLLIVDDANLIIGDDLLKGLDDDLDTFIEKLLKE